MVKQKYFLTIGLAIFLTFIALPAWAAVGEDVIGPISLPGNIPGHAITSPEEAKEGLTAFVRGVIRVAFLVGLVGVLFFFAIGGVRWILSGGDKQQVEQAKSMITAAIIGFAILTLSYLALVLIGNFFGIKIVQDPPPTRRSRTCYHSCLHPNPAIRVDYYAVDASDRVNDCIVATGGNGSLCQTTDCQWWCYNP